MSTGTSASATGWLDAATQAMLHNGVLCWLATASLDGQANVSPKEVFACVDEQHLVIANLASPQSARHIEANPKVCVSCVDVFTQKGVKLLGSARHLRPDDEDFTRWAAPLLPSLGDRFSLRGVFVVRVTERQAIVAPSYWAHPQDTSEASQRLAAMQRYGVQPANDVG